MFLLLHQFLLRAKAWLARETVSITDRQRAHAAKRRSELLKLAARHEAEVLVDLAQELWLRAQTVSKEAKIEGLCEAGPSRLSLATEALPDARPLELASTNGEASVPARKKNR